MSKEDQQLLRKYLPTHFFIYDSGLAHLLGSVNDALLMDNLIYWNGSGGKKGYVYKTVEEMRIETGLSESQQRAAIKRCEEKQILRVKLIGIPAKRHFQISLAAILKLVTESEIIDELDPKKSHSSVLKNLGSNTENNKKLNKEINSVYRLFLSSNGLDESRCRFTTKKALLISERLEESGYRMVCEAVVNCAASEFYNGDEDGVVKGSFAYVFRSRENIETLANLEKRY